jgi:glycosyltransferase involved in cell wall biosynthesis
MNVIYSIAARFGGTGIGKTAYNAALGIHRADVLKRLFVGSNAQREIPSTFIDEWGAISRGVKFLASKDKSGWAYHIEATVFDKWVAARLTNADIFHGWNGMCLNSLERAKQFGITTIVERASSHPVTQFKLLEDEYARWNLPIKLPRWNYERSIAEIERADFVTTPSEFSKQSMIDNGVEDRKLLHIPFGANVETPTRMQRAKTPRPFRVIFVGTLSIRKGVPDLLEAWRLLNWKDAELWLVGGLAGDFNAIQSRWSNVSNVCHIGHVSDVKARYAQSDVFVFPSIEEGSALVTYEAMAAGLPVIVTPNAGAVARHEAEGYIVPIRSPEKIAERLTQLREDSALRESLGQSAIIRAASFTWERYRDRLIATYHFLRGEQNGTQYA